MAKFIHALSHSFVSDYYENFSNADFNSAIPYIRKAEGGLSRATTDTASKYPAPWPYKNQKGWHTNKGITYKTFEALSPQLGYANTADNFFTMPDTIWMPIYKKGYWDQVKGDQYNSQAIANAVVDYAWGFGVAGAMSRIKNWLKSTYGVYANTPSEIADAFNKLTVNGDADVFEKFIAHRKQAFVNLNQSKNNTGWLGRMDALAKDSVGLLSRGVTAAGKKATETKEMIKRNPVPSILIGIGMAIALGVLIKTINNRK